MKKRPKHQRQDFYKPRLILLLLIEGVLLILLFNKQTPVHTKSQNIGKPPEITAMLSAQNNVDEQTKLYRKLIERLGPEQAQEELLHSGLPFNGQTHLVNHAAGDYLFEKYGSSGLIYCKDYFLSSCYHGFVLRVIGASGLDGLDQVIDICSSKGPALMTQCAHAIGHGLLVWFDYPNLVESLHACDQIGSKKKAFPLFNCYDGIFMENIWGVHEGKPSPKRWINADDIIYPCNDPRIEERYINACWAEQPTIMYQRYDGDVKKVGLECLKLISPQYQTTCFDSLARQIQPTLRNIDHAFELCSLMPKGWDDKCLLTISTAYFSLGERNIPFEICQRMTGSNKDCFNNLSGMIAVYATSPSEKKDWCNKITDQTIRQRCY